MMRVVVLRFSIWNSSAFLLLVVSHLLRREKPSEKHGICGDGNALRGVITIMILQIEL